jgi:hypothetical protein
MKKLINKRWWRIVAVAGLREANLTDGECDHVDTERREIRYDPGLPVWLLIDTICHEVLHAAFPMASEHDAGRYGTDVARVLRAVLEEQCYEITRR